MPFLRVSLPGKVTLSVPVEVPLKVTLIFWFVTVILVFRASPGPLSPNSRKTFRDLPVTRPFFTGHISGASLGTLRGTATGP